LSRQNVLKLQIAIQVFYSRIRDEARRIAANIAKLVALAEAESALCRSHHPGRDCAALPHARKGSLTMARPFSYKRQCTQAYNRAMLRFRPVTPIEDHNC
jgi:hypothetical protein